MLAVSAEAASAAIAFADLKGGLEGSRLGPVRFVGSAGEVNHVTVKHDSAGLRFVDSANRVDARGDCEQIDVHTAWCPYSDSGEMRVRLGDRDDKATVDLPGFIPVTGGRGDDVLVGLSSGDALVGGDGDDTLRGGPGGDYLTGGPGRDRLFGGRGDDGFSDGETDAQAAPDVYVGGKSERSVHRDTGDALAYSERDADLRIDLASAETTSEDRIVGLESVSGGSGDDQLFGDDGENSLTGGPGADEIHGRGGSDSVTGLSGQDQLYGDDGADVVWGHGGRDILVGGAGDDGVVSAEERGGGRPDELVCGDGEDWVRTDGLDTLTADCEGVSAFSNALTTLVPPRIANDSAEFTVRCSSSCTGTISVQGTDGQQFGVAQFEIPVPDESAEVLVRVALNADGVAAIQAHTMVRVDIIPTQPTDAAPGGYRILLESGPSGPALVL